MIRDFDLLFSDSQAITASAGSTNTVDLESVLPQQRRNIGVGTDAEFFVQVDVGFTDAGSDSTVTVSLQTDDNTGFAPRRRCRPS